MRFVFVLLFSGLIINLAWGQDGKKMQSAEKAFGNKDYRLALELYTEVIKENNSNDCYYAFYKRAYCNHMLANFNEVKADINKALKVSKKDKQYNFLKGSSNWLYARSLSKLNQKRKALRFLKKATKYLQTSPLYSTIGYVKIQLKQYESALANLNLAIMLDENYAYAYSNRALVYVKLFALDKARADIEKSIRLDEKNPYVYKHSALIYIELKEYENACLELKKSEELGYATFGNESDASEVEELIKRYCNN